MTAASQPAPAALPRLPYLLVVAALLVLALRFVALDGDPPPEMPEANPMDEGLWADGARGQVLFGDWFADDTGNALLVAPLHSVLLAGVYHLFGIGLMQTRLVPALSAALLCALLGAFVGRRLGARAGATAMLLLAVCPLLDQHARSGLLESEQLFWITLAFCAIAERAASLPRAVLAGMALACAGATKPNALTLGAVPLAFVFVDQWRTAARAHLPGCHRRHLLAGVGLVGGALLVLLPFAVFVWLPHLDAWRECIYAESGADEWTLADHLQRLGLAFTREAEPGVLRAWAIVRNAPALAIGALGWCLAAPLRSWRPGERALAIWGLVTLLLAESDFLHVGRRQLLVLPALAALTTFRLFGGAPPEDGPTSRWQRALFWLTATALPLLLVRPAIGNLLAARAADPVTASYRIGWLLPVLWIAAIAALAAAGRLPAPGPWRRGLGRALLPLLAAAALFGITRLGALCDHGTTIAAAQRQLAGTVPSGEVVLGQNASLLFLAEPVRTVRRTLLHEFYATPRANPDAFERLRPRYLLDYRDAGLREFADLPTGDYVDGPSIDYLRERDGTCRYRLVLRHRP